MAANAFNPDTPRHTAKIRGNTWSYVLLKPEGTPKANVFLVHGFPDLGYGWRHQVPYLVAKGYSVLVPDMLGYGQTDAPEAVEEYTLKLLSDDIAALTAHAFGEGARIVLGGHDWGGALVWRTALWYPDLITGVFSVCTPYAPPSATFVDLADIIAAGHLKNFGYQLQLRGPDAEAALVGEPRIRAFLTGMHGGRGPAGEWIFTPEDGVLLANLDKTFGPSALVPAADVDFYVREYLRHGLHGPLNWYRTRRLNFDDEKPLADKAAAAPDGVLKFAMPGLMIAAARDVVLLPSMSLGMGQFFDSFTRCEVDASHWALTERADEVNAHIAEWIEASVLGGADPAVKPSL